MKKHKILKIILLCFALLLVSMVVGGAIYVNDYYHAQTEAIEAMESTEKVDVWQLDQNTYVFEPVSTETTSAGISSLDISSTETTSTEISSESDSESTASTATTGFIFYPGGKVDYRAYAPLMQACAENGILCVLVDMPFNLAVFDINAADGIQEQFPEITNWYIGGHSLGGSMAANYLSKHIEDYSGLILLGSYSVNDISDSTLSVLSIYGSEDQVLNLEKYEKNLSNLPADFDEVVIQGGCHAYYGMYGAQKGDGTPTITNQQQISQTAALIAEFCVK